MGKKKGGKTSSGSSSTAASGFERTERIDPSTVRFTFSRIRPQFSDGKEVMGTYNDIKNGTLDVNSLPMITVLFDAENHLFSLNNRRLFVLKKLCSEGIIKDVEVRLKPMPNTARFTDRYSVDRCALVAKFKGRVENESGEDRCLKENEDSEGDKGDNDIKKKSNAMEKNTNDNDSINDSNSDNKNKRNKNTSNGRNNNNDNNNNNNNIKKNMNQDAFETEGNDASFTERGNNRRRNKKKKKQRNHDGSDSENEGYNKRDSSNSRNTETPTNNNRNSHYNNNNKNDDQSDHSACPSTDKNDSIKKFNDYNAQIDTDEDLGGINKREQRRQNRKKKRDLKKKNNNLLNDDNGSICNDSAIKLADDNEDDSDNCVDSNKVKDDSDDGHNSEP